VIPSLARRASELPQIIDEYAQEAFAELGVEHREFPVECRDWIIRDEAASLSQIEKATIRLLALQETEGNVGRAAKLLGMSRQSLSKWIDRRQLPIAIQGAKSRHSSSPSWLRDRKSTNN
jgi:DNA-binding NtrC family response regulator